MNRLCHISISLANRTRHLVCGLAAVVVAVGVASPVRADVPEYPDAGTYNSTTYTFTAANSGDIVAYWAEPNTASYENQLGLLVNGIQQGGYGLDNQTSAVGDSYDFGFVQKGATLTFILHNVSPLGLNAYSDPSMNGSYDLGPATGTTDGHNHIYSTSYNGSGLGAGIPAGTYVAFEDLRFPYSDYNYHDEQFVFTNVAMTSSTPEPSSALMAVVLGGIGGVGMMLRRRRPAGR